VIGNESGQASIYTDPVALFRTIIRKFYQIDKYAKLFGHISDHPHAPHRAAYSLSGFFRGWIDPAAPIDTFRAPGLYSHPFTAFGEVWG
jgi:hypothetical protein